MTLQNIDPKEEIDLWLIRNNLKLSFEERMEQHQNTIDCVDELKQMMAHGHAKSSNPSQIINSKPS